MSADAIKVRRLSELLNLSPTKEPQRAYLFEVEIIGKNFQNHITDSNIKFLVKSVSVPNTAKEAIVVDYMDKKLIWAGKDSSAHIITVTFWDDESLVVMRYMNDWMMEMGGGEESRSIGKDLYSRQLNINLKDTTDFIRTGIISMKGVFPVEIGEVPLNYDTSDAIELTVTFSYDTKEMSNELTFESDPEVIAQDLLRFI